MLVDGLAIVEFDVAGGAAALHEIVTKSLLVDDAVVVRRLLEATYVLRECFVVSAGR